MNLHDMTPDDATAEAARRSARRAKGLPLHDDGRAFFDYGAADKVMGEPIAVTLDPSRYWHYTGPQSVESSGLREAPEQARVIKLLRLAGADEPTGKHYSLSQARASKQTPGLADVYAVFRDASLAWQGAVWIETKVEGGEISDAQLQFGADERAFGREHIFGDVRAVVDWLVRHGLARYDVDEPHGIAFAPLR